MIVYVIVSRPAGTSASTPSRSTTRSSCSSRSRWSINIHSITIIYDYYYLLLSTAIYYVDSSTTVYYYYVYTIITIITTITITVTVTTVTTVHARADRGARVKNRYEMTQ